MEKDIPSGFCFIIDDDIIYPKNYVKRMIRKIEKYKRRTIVCVHGCILKNKFESYPKSRQAFNYYSELKEDTKIDIVGAGTIAYHTDTLKLSMDDFETTGMSDIWISIKLRALKIKPVCISRKNNWLNQTDYKQEMSLWKDLKNDNSFQTNAIRNKFIRKRDIFQYLYSRYSKYKQLLS
jgi:hypothetical protein